MPTTTRQRHARPAARRPRALRQVATIAIASLLLMIPASGAHASTLEVVATTPALAAIAAEVGGDHVRVRALASPSEDPHYVDARPNFISLLSRADVLLAHGLEYEVGWLPQLQVNSRNARVQVGGEGFVEVSRFVRLLDVPDGPIDRSMGDLHPGGNPHFLNDPRAAAGIAEGIVEVLSRRAPEHAQAFADNATRFAGELRSFAREQRSRFSALPASQRQVITYHKSMTYLLDWLDLELVETVEVRPGIPPSPAHVSRVLQRMRTSGARVILQEQFYPTNTSQRLAQLAGGEVVVIPGGPDHRGGEDYLSFLRRMTDALHDALDRS
ncbi:MAG: zinc ABC transporter substrate-binding protein [Deltaproteobacteria bacterium]|nr:MAG: zinc ABC transporter substrate-binding protein [Deltaproteobacteria bacterium]